ncbi:glycosyltransferase family 4 protein [Akkermansiaceae bacterium]|nr:glycosyltransferase family 4 protein [Akkermansiaceae bacterium]
MKVDIVYLGNKSSQWGGTPTTIETTGKRLKSIYRVKTYSNKRNKILRLAHMLSGILAHRSSNPIIIIDTYSTLAFYFSYLSSILARVLNLKFIIYLHGGDFLTRVKKSKSLFEFMANNCEKILCPSEFIENIISQKVDKKKIEIIPNSIDLKKYPFSCRRNKIIKIFWLRAFHQIYNPFMALDVLERLLDEGWTVHLSMVGPDKDGTLRLVEKEIKDRGLDLYVDLYGKKSLDEWFHLSKEDSFFINTSSFDNMPVSVIEAMALGMCVISTNVGGIPFLVDDERTGFLVEENDSKAMAKIISNMQIDEEAYGKVTKSARENAAKYDWKNLKNKWIKIVEQAKANQVDKSELG